MNFKIDPQFHETYLRWLESLGVSYEEMSELIDHELQQLPPQERNILADFDCWRLPGALTPTQHDVLIPVLARAIEKARVVGQNKGKEKATHH